MSRDTIFYWGCWLVILIELYRDGFTLAGDDIWIFWNAFTLIHFLKKRQHTQMWFRRIFVCIVLHSSYSVLHQKLCKMNSKNQQEPHRHFMKFQPGGNSAATLLGFRWSSFVELVWEELGKPNGMYNKHVGIFCFRPQRSLLMVKQCIYMYIYIYLGGGFKYFLFSTLPGEMIHFD